MQLFCSILTADDWCLQYRFQELNIGWTGLTMAGVEAVVTGILSFDARSQLNVSLSANLLSPKFVPQVSVLTLRGSAFLEIEMPSLIHI